jgi:hypothetical protein
MITANEHQMSLIMNAYHRSVEVYQYQVNIDNYLVVLNGMPTGPWDADIAQYQGADISSLPMDMSYATLTRIMDFQYRDRLRTLVRTESIEQNKSQRILDALIAQIDGDANALMLEYKASLQPTA